MIEAPYLWSYTRSFPFANGATRANGAADRSREHLDKALAEVDGLFAGLKYIDETEPVQPHSFCQPLNLRHFGTADGFQPATDGLSLELEVLSAAASQNGHLHSDPSLQRIDWSSIRHVRDGMESLWQSFVGVSRSLDLPVINNIRTTYQDAKGFREAGVFAFRNTLTGPTPNDLTKIFAFCSLSYVVSQLLHTRGRLEEQDILAGVSIWLNALENREERQAFNILAERLWPEARNHLYFLQLGRHGQSQNAAAPWAAWNYAPPSLAHGSLPPNFAAAVSSPAWSGYDAASQVPPFAGFDLQNPDSLLLNTFAREASSDLTYGLTNETSDLAMHWPNCRHIPASSVPPPPWNSSNQQGQSSDPNTDLPQSVGGRGPTQQTTTSNSLPAPPTSHSQGDSEGLRDTKMFTALYLFFQENGDLLYILSGRGMTSKGLRSCLAWNQERLGDKKRIYRLYMEPLISEMHTKDAPCRGIVSAADAFVELGYLQSIEDVKTYLMAVGEVSQRLANVE
ncbi:hypothetical protein ACJ41O_001756 [Fusarium nematophilum]